MVRKTHSPDITTLPDNIATPIGYTEMEIEVIRQQQLRRRGADVEDDEHTLLGLKHRLVQAFQFAPQMTLGMVQSVLNTKVPPHTRDLILGELRNEGKVAFGEHIFVSLHGRTSRVTIVRWVG